MPSDNQQTEAAQRAFMITPFVLKHSSIQPAPRGGATLTQVENGKIYLIGGANREAMSLNDVYELDLADGKWKLVSNEPDAMKARSGHSAVAVGPSIIVFGGLNATECEVYNDIHVFDTQKLQWIQVQVEGDIPAPRNAHAVIVLPSHDDFGCHQMLLYGGSSPDHGAFDDVFLLHIPNLNTISVSSSIVLRWEKLATSGEVPEARELHCAALLSSTTVCFSGGRNRDGNICTDMAFLNCDTWEWQLIPICEWNRCSHTTGVVNGRLTSFGGWDGGAIRGDCWIYSDNEEAWLQASQHEKVICSNQDGDRAPQNSLPAQSSVSERFGHAGCTIVMSLPEQNAKSKSTTDALLVFGGMNATSDLNDLVLIREIQSMS